jgi:hypothetical protein
MEKAKGGRGKTTSNALGVLGITHTQSSRWQRIADCRKTGVQKVSNFRRLFVRNAAPLRTFEHFRMAGFKTL